MSTEFSTALLARPPVSGHPLCAVVEESCLSHPLFPAREKRYATAAVGFVLSGWFDYHSQGGSATGVPGTLVFANPEECFRCHHKDTKGNRRLVAHFSQDILEEVASDHGYDDAAFHRAVLPPGRLPMEMFGWMRRMASQPGCEETAYVLAALALRPGVSPAAPEPVSARDRGRIFKVVRHIEEFYTEPCTLEVLAGMVDLSRYHFLHIFKMVTGQSPNRYLIDTRLRAAADRLSTTKAPIGEIALDVGFNDISHFNACFRAMFDSSPRQWRSTN